MGKTENTDSKESSRSWFCVLNNPKSVFTDLEKPEDMVDAAIEKWCFKKPHRTCAVNYEIGDSGNHHMHMVLEDPSKSRFSAVQKLFPGIHIAHTRGTKEQAEDYINKRGRFAEKSHTVIIPARYKGQIKANQGKRSDLDTIQELIDMGLTPKEIMDKDIHFLVHESVINKAYFNKRYNETPPERENIVFWHVGVSGSGKSHSYIDLGNQYGSDKVYLLNDFDKGGFDMYNGEPILFMDEFKCNMRFQLLLNVLDGYRMQIPCRYANKFMLWTETHITTIFPPDIAYQKMVLENRDLDTQAQLFRRINYIVFHWRDSDGFHSFTLPMSDYKNYDDLKQRAFGSESIPVYEQEKLPF